jgi:hypothetical protein
MLTAAILEAHTVTQECRAGTCVHAMAVLYLLETTGSAFQVRFF